MAPPFREVESMCRGEYPPRDRLYRLGQITKMYGFKVRRVTIFHIKFFKSGRVAKSFIITKGQEIQNTKTTKIFF